MDARDARDYVRGILDELSDLESYASRLALGQDPLVKPNLEVFAGLITDAHQTTGVACVFGGQKPDVSGSGFTPQI